MDTLHIDNGFKKIQVNDEGECIEFSIVDNDFFGRFSELVKWIEGQEKVIRDMQLQQEKAVAGENIDFEALGNVLAIRSKISSEVCKRIDSIFGDEASRKIFGGISPDFLAITDFLGQIMPLIESYAKERRKNINCRYSKNRRGAKS